MGSISDKLSYLNTTKGKIKDAINCTGAGITDNDTFRSYARTLKDSLVDIINDGTSDLYDNFTKKTGTGTSVTLSDIYAAPMETQVQGKCEQDTYSGKNKANTTGNPDFLYSATQYEKSGTTIIVKNNTTSVYAYVQYYIDNLKPNTTYTISFDGKINTGIISVDVQKIRDSAIASDRLLKLDSSTSGHVSGQFTTPADTSTMSINIYSLRGTYYENASVTYSNIQIEEGSSETSYEQWVGGIQSPNPDFPQKIKTISGIENLFDINATPIYVNNTNSTAITNGVRVSVDTTGTGSYFALYKILDVSDYVGETFTIKMDFDSSHSNGGNYIIGLCDENGGNRISGKTSNLVSGVELSYTIPTITTSQYLAVWLYSNNSGSSTAGDYVDYTNIQLVKGNILVPYGHWLPIKVQNKNLFDGIWELGIINSDSGQNADNNNIMRNKNYIPVQELTNYKFSFDTTAFTKILVYEYKEDFSYNLTSNKGVDFLTNYLTTNAGTKYIRFRPYTSDAYVDLTLKGQIEEGTTTTDYTEHQEQTTLIDLNKENLFDKDNPNTFNGYINVGNSKIVSSDSTTSIYIPCKPNTTYTVSKISSSRFAIGYTANVPVASGDITGIANNNVTHLTITTDSNANYLMVWFYHSSYDTTTTADKIMNSIKIFEGTSPKSYYELCSSGNDKDLLNIKNGSAIITKNINNIVLNGSENGWTSGTITGGNRYYYAITTKSGENLELIKSNYFKGIIYNNRNSNPFNTIYTNGINLGIGSNTLGTLANFKTWLYTHNTDVYYVLATPETITLKGTYNIKSYEGVTHISIFDDDLEPTISASALSID